MFFRVFSFKKKLKKFEIFGLLEYNISMETMQIPITELEQSAFCTTEGNFRTKTLGEEFKSGVRWQKIPSRYLRIPVDELNGAIKKARGVLGDKIVVLGHHYQREDVIKHSDIQGDSYKLAKLASEQDAEVIIFCGVHFMAETAEILSSSNQRVILPNMAAGCSMADMASTEQVADSWHYLAKKLRTPITPLTYMNSTAEIKAICGKNNGIVCTSSNAGKALSWAFDQGAKVLFIPDQHLGRNTALEYGIPEDEMVIWDPYKAGGGISDYELDKAKMILWKGHCSVHTRFSVTQINEARTKNPKVNILVHPECTNDVVSMSDYVGSTEYIKDMVHNAPNGSSWAIGTEINLVKRLAHTYPEKNIFCLDEMICPCSTMYRVHPAYLLWVLDGLIAGIVINQIKVKKSIQLYAKIALERMLAL